MEESMESHSFPMVPTEFQNPEENALQENNEFSLVLFAQQPNLRADLESGDIEVEKQDKKVKYSNFQFGILGFKDFRSSTSFGLFKNGHCFFLKGLLSNEKLEIINERS